MDEVTQGSEAPVTFAPTPEDVRFIEEGERILSDLDYYPKWLIEKNFPEGLEGKDPSWKPVLRPRERSGLVMENFPQFIKGSPGSFADWPPERTADFSGMRLDRDRYGRSWADLIADANRVAGELGLDVKSQAEEAEREYGPGRTDEMHLARSQYVFPVFRKLVLELGYDPIDLKS